ncbi:endonuclease/exonuclease/phosphatase family protein [Brachybacterium sacelli]|uniref:Endonuclease/exonuclease/phosphatase family metal-dependent hydrolase n=1 Tax=Brachybacterium sacelli TaxID=173364 RepID=A0ABS4X068_9MICO|nr:endonuclease/exonuclease/phosphatase family protein [Brachybacterium sacelli]MBP2381854.1 endonuclease/exonuclease/phosphatase family metal-dependent hydrolase [Brachybacterium sacelli]
MTRTQDRPSTALRLLTQNIRQHRPETSPGESDHWGDRAPVLVELLRAADADVVGTQEVLPSQVPVLDGALAATHLRLGIGRDGGGRGEHNLLFLRRDRFEVLDWDQFWLSEQPALMGSVGWDGHCPRIAVWARVRDRRGGGELVLAVTHLDHAGPRARERGAMIIAQRLREAADGAPVVLMGDFNAAGGDSAPWRVLRDAGFEDAHDVAVSQEGEDIGTFPDYRAPVVGGERIDWILARDVTVESYSASVPELEGRVASDHATVAAVVTTR